MNTMIIDRDRWDKLRQPQGMIIAYLDYIFIHEGQESFTVYKDRKYGKQGKVIESIQELRETYPEATFGM